MCSVLLSSAEGAPSYSVVLLPLVRFLPFCRGLAPGARTRAALQLAQGAHVKVDARVVGSKLVELKLWQRPRQMHVTQTKSAWNTCCGWTLTMSDEGEESDSGEKAHLSESPSPPPPVLLHRGSPSPQRPLDLFSSASPLLEDTDPPYLATLECLQPSPEHREPGDSAHFTPPKFRQRTGVGASPFRSQQDVRLDAGSDCYDEPFPKWRGRGAERFQHRGQRLPRAPELSDFRNHFTVDNIEPEFSSQTRQTWVTPLH